MKNESIWKSGAPDTLRYPGLSSDVEAEVAIIGGGITGLSVGFFLARQGIKVSVLEATYVGSGTTGNSTGNLYIAIDEMYHEVISKYDLETARLLAESRKRAMVAIDEIIGQYQIDCDYKKTSWNLIAETRDAVPKLEKEYNALIQIGIEATLSAKSAVFPDAHACLTIPDQAHFNPKKYAIGLAKAAVQAGCIIYEETRVLEFEDVDNGVLIHTTRGSLRSRKVVKATHSPIGEKLITTLLGPYREYVVAARIKTPFPSGTYWTQQDEHHYSVRTAMDGSGQTHLLCLGEPHKVGQDEENTERLKKLETYLRNRFDVGKLTYTWGAQHYKSADLIPYIGIYNNDKIFLATGYSTDGLVYGTVAGLLITDLIQGKPNDWQEIYDPKRKNPIKSAGRVFKENLNVLNEFVKGRIPFRWEADPLQNIEKGEGKVVVIDGKKYGVYRNAQGELSVVSAICPHMGCIVRWNNAERSWDCPCHGSRFTTTGKYIEGPSLQDLINILPSQEL